MVVYELEIGSGVGSIWFMNNIIFSDGFVIIVFDRNVCSSVVIIINHSIAL